MTLGITLTAHFEFAQNLGETLLRQTYPDSASASDKAGARKSVTVDALSLALRSVFTIRQDELDKLLWEAMPSGEFEGLETVIRMRQIRAPIDFFEFEQASKGVTFRVARVAPRQNRMKAFINRPSLGNRVFINTGTDYPKIRRVLGPSLWSMVMSASLASRTTDAGQLIAQMQAVGT